MQNIIWRFISFDFFLLTREGCDSLIVNWNNLMRYLISFEMFPNKIQKQISTATTFKILCIVYFAMSFLSNHYWNETNQSFVTDDWQLSHFSLMNYIISPKTGESKYKKYLIANLLNKRFFKKEKKVTLLRIGKIRDFLRKIVEM